MSRYGPLVVGVTRTVELRTFLRGPYPLKYSMCSAVVIVAVTLVNGVNAFVLNAWRQLL